MERLHTIWSVVAVLEKNVLQNLNKNVFNNCLGQMITSYKESNTEKEFNEKPINVDHSKRHLLA